LGTDSPESANSDFLRLNFVLTWLTKNQDLASETIAIHKTETCVFLSGW